MTRLSVDETRAAFEGIRKQIKDLEGSIIAIRLDGSGPLETSGVITAACNETIDCLQQARGKIEKLICWFDS